VEPLGFTMDDRQLRRAGLDYHEFASVQVHRGYAELKLALGERRLFALTTRAARRYSEVEFRVGDAFLFGPETQGLPHEVLAGFAPDMRLKLPMLPGNRSVNLSNAVAVVVFEAWRQLGFLGGG
jgi:tRNA (cytidine/uridine-2'-O-)-methyltransferase